jgi:hypothetical protein
MPALDAEGLLHFYPNCTRVLCVTREKAYGNTLAVGAMAEPYVEL